MVSDALSYPRDASLWSNPGYAFAEHFLGDDGWSRCGMVVLNLDRGTPAEEVPSIMRCQKSGCRQRWTAVAFVA
jgi:hypothetical protein